MGGKGQRQRLLVVNSNYPHENNLYGDVFVHARVKQYINELDVVVMGLDSSKRFYNFTYEGVQIKYFPSKNDLGRAILEYQPDAILIHFVMGWMYKAFIDQARCPVLIWVHGEEALGWYRRLFNFKSLKQFGGYIARNTRQLWQLRKLIEYANQSEGISFIFVSEWMRTITEKDTLSKIKSCHIIPNPIDASIFKYAPKEAEDRKKILLIRSFGSKKYANDIAIEAIRVLSKKDFFSELIFSIYGEGKYFEPLTEGVRHLPNVRLWNHFIEYKNIPEAHKAHGVFLCPTRQDAQGVSMCEAMSSGLVPISSNNTAIPEFVDEGKTGFITNSAQEVADRIEYLFHFPNEFLKISKHASQEIQRISGHATVFNKELRLIKEKIASHKK